MIEKSQLVEKIEEGIRQINGIRDTQEVMGSTLKDSTDFECLIVHHESMIRESERINLYVEDCEDYEDSEEKEYIEGIKKEIEEGIKNSKKLIISCLKPSY